jgi:hypothetical protein
MNTQRVGTRRLWLSVAGILTWFAALAALHSFVTGGLVTGVLDLTGALAVFWVVVDGRLLRRLEGRPLSNVGLAVLGLLAVTVVVSEALNMQFRHIYFLGEIDIPSVILIVRGIGSLILAGILLWELLRLARQRA